MKSIKYFVYLGLLLMVTSSFSYPGEVADSFKTPYNFSTGLTFDGKYLWAADYKADKLVAIDPANGNVIREIPSPGFWPMGLAWDGKYLWNADYREKKIFKINPADGTILFAVDSPSDNPEGLTWDGKTLWVCDAGTDEIMKIDLSDGTAVEKFASPAKYPQGLTFDGTYLWCSDRIQNEIYMVDPGSGEVILVMDSPGPYPRGLAWDGKYLWNLDYQNDRIYKLIRKDDEVYRLKNERDARITFTHQVKATGTGKIQNLNVFIAIPEDMPQQKIKTKKFLPAEYKLVKDRWNQPFAQFQYQNIPSEQIVNTEMIIEAQISDIQYFIYPDKCGKLSDIPQDIKKTYTANGSKYMIQDDYIKNLAKTIVGEEQNPYWIARKIFDYVRENLEYKLEGGWNVAPVVLKRGTGSCSEYTFSFIALCHAAGLPARFVGSIVVRGDDASLDDVFHRWPEVYLPNYGWIPIDPEGGDRPLPRDQAMYIGHLSNRFLITTQGGGDSEYIGWYYNSYETYNTDPQIKMNIETFGEWEPLKN